MSGNFKFIYEEMLKQQLDKTLVIHSIFKPNIANRRSFIDKLKFPYFLGKSKYILVDDYHPMIYKLQFRKPRNSSSMACRGCFQDCRI